MKKAIEYHEAANIFPLDEEHLDELAQDIRKYGLKESIKLLDGKILDGRRRSLACEKAGVQARYEEVQTDDPLAYVVSVNLHRRHLTPSQTTMVVARATELREKYKQKAEERMQAGKGSDGSGGRGNKINPSAARREGLASPGETKSEEPMKTSEQMGNLFGVGSRTVERATRVLNTAVPEVVKAVDEGRMSVNAAEKLVGKEPEVQRKAAKEAKAAGERKPKPTPEPEEESNGEIEIKGVGVIRAHEAINCLTRIPKNDAQRKRGFQIVCDWMRHNP